MKFSLAGHETGLDRGGVTFALRLADSHKQLRILVKSVKITLERQSGRIEEQLQPTEWTAAAEESRTGSLL